jgi:HEAT repeat protein
VLRSRRFRLMSLATVALCATGYCLAADPTDVFTEDFLSYQQLVQSPLAELRLSGVDGFAWLKSWRAEPYVLPLAADPDPAVRREVAWALSRVGRVASLRALAGLLRDADSGARRQARASIECLTQQQDLTPEQVLAIDPVAREGELLAVLAGADAAARLRALRALRCFAGAGTEEALLGFLTSASPPPGVDEQIAAMEVLERVGTEAAVPWLASVAEARPEAAWALGEIGGPQAEEALRRGLARFGTYDQAHVLNLDRVHSTLCAAFVPSLVNSVGCITYRGQPEDLCYDPAPLQRACANVIRRSGRANEVVECVLRELECRSVDAEIAPDLLPVMTQMRPELAPGFIRNDGWVTSQPLSAMALLVDDRRLAPRLVRQLSHPAYLVRVYVAMALGRLGAVEAGPAVLEMVEQGYPFQDAVTAVSGKHFGDSQTVRWRGFLCMALGRMGGEENRLALERLATGPDGYRDVRFGAVVGLGFIGSPESLPALRKVASEDLIWRTRQEALDTIHRIELSAGAHAKAEG